MARLAATSSRQYVVRLLRERRGERRLRLQLQRRQSGPHALQGPEQVDRGGTALRQQLECRIHAERELGAGHLLQAPRLERDAIGGGAADGRRAAHHHAADGSGDPRRRIVGQHVETRRQHPLIDHLDSAADVVPTQRLSAGHRSAIQAPRMSAGDAARGRRPPRVCR
jgi:hypothetical protein